MKSFIIILCGLLIFDQTAANVNVKVEVNVDGAGNQVDPPNPDTETDTLTTTPNPCGSGILIPIPYPGSDFGPLCYYTDRKTVNDSQLFCSNEHAALLNYKTSNLTKLKNFLDNQAEGVAWIDLTKLNSTTWMWPDGTRVDGSDVEFGADNTCGRATEKSDFLYSSGNCEDKIPFICQLVS